MHDKGNVHQKTEIDKKMQPLMVLVPKYKTSTGLKSPKDTILNDMK